MDKAKWIAFLEREPIDRNIRKRVFALNRFDGVVTTSSCGGHEHPTPGQYPADTWGITFSVDRTDSGWFALEFLSWLVNNDARRADRQVRLYPYSAPPWLNEPGQTMHFKLDGWDGEDADRLAAWMDRQREENYVAPVDPTD